MIRKNIIWILLLVMTILLTGALVLYFLVSRDPNIVGITIINDTNKSVRAMYCTDLDDNDGIINPGKDEVVPISRNSGLSSNGCYIADPAHNNVYIGCVIPSKSVKSGDRYYISHMNTKQAWDTCGDGQ